MTKICPGCEGTFARVDTLKRHLENFPGHSKHAISTVFEEHSIPRSPITDAFCGADLVHLSAMETGRLELFGQFVPRISSVDNWKSSHSFQDIRRITLGDMLQGNNPVMMPIVFSSVSLITHR